MRHAGSRGWQEDGLQLQVSTPAAVAVLRVRPWPDFLHGIAGQRVLLRDVSLWLPQSPPISAPAREAQMLLYNHPFNDAQRSPGLPYHQRVFGYMVRGSLATEHQQAAHTFENHPLVVDACAKRPCADWPAWKSGLASG